MKILKRIGASVLAIVMVLSTMSINVFAETYTETEPYLYLYGDTPIAEFQGKASWYWSPHRGMKTYADGTTSRTDVPMMFPLLNMSTMETIKTYCIDSGVSVADVAEYRRLNLEDSTYFSAEDAAKLRAIFLNGFTDASQTADIQAAANTWLASKGMDQIADLTGAQALAATQYAIWCISNSEISDIVYYDTYSAKDSWLVSMYDTVGVNPQETVITDDEGNNITEKNINLLTDYLLSIDGVAATTVLVSDATLAGATVSDPVDAGDGTYSVTVTANIDGVKTGDALYLTAMSGAKNATVAVTASGATSVVLDGLTDGEANGMITVEINGTQKGNDVYLYDAKGPRGASQTMVGFDTGVMNVHAEAVVGNDERILKIHKTNEADGTGLANISFTLYQVATSDEIANGAVVIGQTPTAEDIAKYATRNYEVVTVTTDANGYAEYNLSRNGIEDGVFIVTETATESVKESVAPFFVSIPDNSKTTVAYTVTVEVENEVIYDEPGIDKSVTWLNNKSDTVDAGDKITWIIDSYIPFDIGTGMDYSVTTEVDDRLSVPSDVTVNVADFDVDENVLPLVADEDYTVKIVPGANGGGILAVTLTKAGMEKVSKTVDGTPEDYVVRISYKNIMNDNAKVGENIDNDATVDYTNSVGLTYTKKSETVEVHTGGLKVNKVDDAGNPVAGAVFKVARVATDAEIADSEIEKITVDGKTCVYVDFFKTEKFEGEKVYEVTTDGDGLALIYGLAYGDYYVIEVFAPSDYIMDSTPIEAEVDADSHTEANVIEVVNVRINSDSDENTNPGQDSNLNPVPGEDVDSTPGEDDGSASDEDIDSTPGEDDGSASDEGIGPTPDEGVNQNPSTGDSNIYIVFVAALMLSGSVVCLLAVRKKREF